MNTSWHSYPKVWAIGHAAVSELFYDDVVVQEKVDGSQFSFGIFKGELKCRSKGQELNIDAPEKMFEKAVDYVKSIQQSLIDGYTYRCEYLQKPKHNVLAYDRVPKNNLVLFDVNHGEEAYYSLPGTLECVAEALGLECMPELFRGKISTAVDLEKYLDTMSFLGGKKIEGFVCKNYSRFGKDKKALMGKYVSENFKEKHKKDWKESNPDQNDIIRNIIGAYRTPARWDKAIIHLQERGLLTDSPRDIGLVIKEVPKDLIEECGDEIKDILFKWAFPQLIRGCNRGLAEYYKERLFKSQFEGDVNGSREEG
jgi:hypothetical protein